MTLSNIEAVSDAELNEMLAGLEGVTPGPRHMYVSPTDILVTDDAGNNIAHFLPMDDDSNADFVNATSFARCDPDTLRSIITELQSSRKRLSFLCQAGDLQAGPIWGSIEGLTNEEILTWIDDLVSLPCKMALRELLSRRGYRPPPPDVSLALLDDMETSLSRGEPL